jgi:outer membrane protein OmpA-like peptidoglycan-associated protein
MIEELRRGSTTIRDQYSRSLFGMPLMSERSGTLTRVAFGKLPVLVNGRIAELRVIRARGELRDAMTNEPETVDMVALDDLEYPLYLRWHESKSDSRVVRIDFPEATAARARVEAALAARKPLDVYNVYFAFASATLRPQSKPALDDVAAVLKKHPDWKLRIEGHTDNVGGNASNLALSQRRANAVRDALVLHGVAPARLTARGYGGGEPLVPADSEAARRKNERITFKLEGGGAAKAAAPAKSLDPGKGLEAPKPATLPKLEPPKL